MHQLLILNKINHIYLLNNRQFIVDNQIFCYDLFPLLCLHLNQGKIVLELA